MCCYSFQGVWKIKKSGPINLVSREHNISSNDKLTDSTGKHFLISISLLTLAKINTKLDSNRKIKKKKKIKTRPILVFFNFYFLLSGNKFSTKHIAPISNFRWFIVANFVYWGGQIIQFL